MGEGLVVTIKKNLSVKKNNHVTFLGDQGVLEGVEFTEGFRGYFMQLK